MIAITVTVWVAGIPPSTYPPSMAYSILIDLNQIKIFFNLIDYSIYALFNIDVLNQIKIFFNLINLVQLDTSKQYRCFQKIR